MKLVIDFPDKTKRHILCQTGPSSCCKWKKNEKDDEDPNYIPKVNLPVLVHEEIQKHFNALSDDNLLKKCTHGKTQNCNEGLNNIIWSRCPKNIFVKRSWEWHQQYYILMKALQVSNGYLTIWTWIQSQKPSAAPLRKIKYDCATWTKKTHRQLKKEENNWEQ